MAATISVANLTGPLVIYKGNWADQYQAYRLVR
jgi:hypothetical protein